MSINEIKDRVFKILGPFFSTRAAAVYLLLFAAAIGTATFIENDFGTSAAQKVVYKTGWFELLLFLFGATIVVNIFRFRMVKTKKWAQLTFHLAMIIILLGAAVTRYFGYEGMMHIRENDSSNRFLSAETYLNFEVEQNGSSYRFDEPVLFASLGNNHWKGAYQVGSNQVDIEVTDFIPNPTQVMETVDDGVPTLKLVVAGMSGREEYFLNPGQQRQIRGLRYNFTGTYDPAAINLWYRNDSLLLQGPKVMTATTMATQQRDTLYPSGGPQALRFRALYNDGTNNFVFSEFSPSAEVRIESENSKVRNESLTALRIQATVNGVTRETLVYGQKGVLGRPSTLSFGDLNLALSYGAKYVQLPFSIYLYDFIMEKYPGTESAASYASEVQLIDSRKAIREDHRIFMNNILNYGGYRFFQSSFDKDEKGTYLSVNHDFWGTWISYIGYAVLTIGLIMIFFSRNTRFGQVGRKLKQIKAGRAMILATLVMAPVLMNAQKEIMPDVPIVDAAHAMLFSEMVVQDHKGRMKPMHTLTREVMRKVARKESMYDLSADQVILGMYAGQQEWMDVPMIKLGKHERIGELLGVNGPRAAYSDFFDAGGGYKLRDEVRRAYGLQPIDRGTLEKELMKIDERVNIVSMIYSGRLFKMIPLAGDEANTWAGDPSSGHGMPGADDPVATRFYPSYRSAVHDAIHSGDYTLANQILSELVSYQNKMGADVMPSAARVNTEIRLNKMNVFNRLSNVYSLLGLGFLVLLFISVFKPKAKLSIAFKIMLGLAALGFLFHTAGLGMRWYVSGRAPWSNGYESMIYIGWTTALAGLIFTRKSAGGLAATMVLAGTILMVARLSYLDPEITPLVPVLRSYWLTIHVSLEAGSYGFLMLGAIIGIINLILIMFLNQGNIDRIRRVVKELSLVSEMTLTGGLVMISIGTYLGGVWANESWGRYWGWDAKETWALVTILVYAFILHMRLVPKLQGLYAFNLATLFGLASVIMTYFGVNYYLSGLHSYAAGDPVPIPTWVYISVASLALISIVAYIQKRRYSFV